VATSVPRGAGGRLAGGWMGGWAGMTGRSPGSGDEPPGSLRDALRDRHLLRQVARQFIPYRRRVAIVGVLILFTSGLGVANPLLIKLIFDKALFVPGGPKVGLLIWLVSLMITIPAISSVIGVYQSYLTNIVGQSVMRDLRARLYEHLQKLSLRFFTGTRTGEIQSRLANDVGGLQTVITETASTILSNSVILLSTVAAMLVLSWQLTVLSLVLTPLFLWLTSVVGRARRRVAAQTQQSLAEMSAITEETLSVSGVLLAKVFGQQAAETQRYVEQNERLAGLQMRQQMIGRVFFATVSTFFSIMPALVYLVAGFTHGLSPGTLVAFTTLQSRLYMPIGQLLQTMTEVSSSLALFERVFGYLDLEPDIVDPVQPTALPTPVRGHVQLDQVWFSYHDEPPDAGAARESPVDSPHGTATNGIATGGTASNGTAAANGGTPANGAATPSGTAIDEAAANGTATDGAAAGGPAAGAAAASGAAARPANEAAAADSAPADGAAPAGPVRRWALRDLSLDIPPGTLAAIVGPSGAGKTTISYLVPRLYEAGEGRVSIDGVDVRELSFADTAGAVGMVTQESYLFHASIRDNLRYARPDATGEEIEAAAQAAQIHDRIVEFDNGYDTLVGERGYRLSGGEKQRIAIARVILKDPRVLILDEATSALDTANERLVQAALAPLMAGRTTIAIAHRLSTIRSADVIFVMDRGRLVESGTHDELLDRGGHYAELYDQQFGGGLVEARCRDGVVLSSGRILDMPDADSAADHTAGGRTAGGRTAGNGARR
jgi:ATP-binding cassette, subfamily B, bacterial